MPAYMHVHCWQFQQQYSLFREIVQRTKFTKDFVEEFAVISKRLADFGTDGYWVRRCSSFHVTYCEFTAWIFHSFIHSFIHIKHLYSASSRELLRGAPDSSTAKKIIIYIIAFRTSCFHFNKSKPDMSAYRHAYMHAYMHAYILKKFMVVVMFIQPCTHARTHTCVHTNTHELLESDDRRSGNVSA